MHVSRLLIMTTLLIFAGSCWSQRFVGLYGGLDNSEFSGDTPISYGYSFRQGYVLGLALGFRLTDDVDLSIRPNYNENGANIAFEDLGPVATPFPATADEVDTVFSFPIRNRSFTLPVLLQVNTSKNFYATAGLEYIRYLSSEVEINDQFSSIDEFINQNGVSAVFGFGVGVPIGRTSINFDLSYAQGLTLLTTDEDIEAGLAPRIRVRNIRLTAYLVLFTRQKNE